MTDNIQKLYEIAGVKRSKPSCVDCFLKNQSCNRSYDECPELYPTFTAEKQIEIIKFLIGKHASFDIFKNYEQKDLYMVHYECRYFPEQYLPFGEALAESINYLWQSLTEKEKEQIKEILE